MYTTRHCIIKVASDCGNMVKSDFTTFSHQQAGQHHGASESRLQEPSRMGLDSVRQVNSERTSLVQFGGEEVTAAFNEQQNFIGKALNSLNAEPLKGASPRLAPFEPSLALSDTEISQ